MEAASCTWSCIGGGAMISDEINDKRRKSLAIPYLTFSLFTSPCINNDRIVFVRMGL